MSDNNEWCPKLKSDIEFAPFDTGYREEKYLILHNDRKFILTEFLYNLALCLNGKLNVKQIAELLSKKYIENFSSQEIKQVIDVQFKQKQFLTDSEEEKKEKKSFLLIQISILKGKNLIKVTDIFKHLYFKPIFWTIIILAVLQRIIMYYKFNPVSENYITLMILVYMSVIFHELGHASACRFFGGYCHEIGFGFYFTIPVFYADVTDSWNFKRSQRIIVDFGGAYFQLIFTLILYILYLLTSDQIYCIAIFTIDLMLLFSLNPFLKYDGYWVLSDVIGIHNLHSHARNVIVSIIKRKLPNEFNLLRKKEKIILLFYSIGTLVFYAYFFTLMFKQGISFLSNLKGIELKSFQLNLNNLINFKTFRTFLMLFLLGKLVWRGLKNLFKRLFKKNKKYEILKKRGI